MKITTTTTTTTAIHTLTTNYFMENFQKYSTSTCSSSNKYRIIVIVMLFRFPFFSSILPSFPFFFRFVSLHSKSYFFKYFLLTEIYIHFNRKVIPKCLFNVVTVKSGGDPMIITWPPSIQPTSICLTQIQ